MKRRTQRRDANEAAIVRVLQQVGATVDLMNPDRRSGRPDLLVGFRRVTYLLEVKTERGKLKASQVRWRGWWRGGPVHVVRTPEEAMRAIGAIT